MMLNTNVGMPTSSIMTGLLTQRRSREFAKNKSQLFLKPTEDGKFYRLRLLNTQPPENFVRSSNFAHYRDFPFIIQHIHQVWHDIPSDDPAKTKRVCNTIVCPQTDYVKANTTLSKNHCPMCSAYGAAWKAFNDSHFKNQEAKNKMKALHNTFAVRCLVYVVNDPNYEGNNGAVKVLTLDEDAYQALLAQIQTAQGNNTPIWNNDACDLFFTWGKVERVKNEGKPNEYRFKKLGFTRIGFTTSPKHIDALTDDMVDDVQFDANWYTIPTKEELDTFYVENFSSQASTNDDIPIDIPPLAAATSAPKPAAPRVAPIVNDLATDPDDLPPPPAPAPKVETKAEPKIEPKKEVVKEAALAEDINQKIEDILAGMPL